MSNNIYITRQGDRLDQICHELYGYIALSPILNANPGLADQDPILPAGIEIILPASNIIEDIEQANSESTNRIRLWS